MCEKSDNWKINGVRIECKWNARKYSLLCFVCLSVDLINIGTGRLDIVRKMGGFQTTGGGSKALIL